MRQFWFFTADDGGRPHFPAGVTPRRCSHVGALYLLGATSGHAHLWVGLGGRPDARMTGDYALHFHDVVWYSNAWHVLTTGAPDHDHDVPEQPTWWLVCALLRDADVATCAADAQMFNVGEITDGALSTTTWSAETQATWTSRMESGLYLALPEIVNNDERFVVWLKNLLGLRGGERGYRCPGPSEE